jgi:hypothetical protein
MDGGLSPAVPVNFSHIGAHKLVQLPICRRIGALIMKSIDVLDPQK